MRYFYLNTLRNPKTGARGHHFVPDRDAKGAPSLSVSILRDSVVVVEFREPRKMDGKKGLTPGDRTAFAGSALLRTLMHDLSIQLVSADQLISLE
jgi:hypothetical protein